MRTIDVDPEEGEQDANPGPYLDNDGSYYFDLGVETFGPFGSEEEAEQVFCEALLV